jgi:hypothetical protein
MRNLLTKAYRLPDPGIDVNRGGIFKWESSPGARTTNRRTVVYQFSGAISIPGRSRSLLGRGQRINQPAHDGCSHDDQWFRHASGRQ